MTDKDIRFTEKKVDQSWKEQAVKEKETSGSKQAPDPQTGTGRAQTPKPETSKAFLNFLTSLGIQTMMHLGEVPNPETQEAETNIEAAREMIDLLVTLKAKTENNRGPEEQHFFLTFLPELQLKFAEKT